MQSMSNEGKEIIWFVVGVAGSLILILLGITGKFVSKVADGYERSIQELNSAWSKNNAAISALANAMEGLTKEMRQDREMADVKYRGLDTQIRTNHDFMLKEDQRHDDEISRLRVKSHEYGQHLTIILFKIGQEERAKKLQNDLEEENTSRLAKTRL